MLENAKVKMERADYGEMQKDVLGGSHFSFVFPIDFNFFSSGLIFGISLFFRKKQESAQSKK